MAERVRASATSKPSTRSQRILALVPKVRAGSDIEQDESSEDEFKSCRRNASYDSSHPPSLPSSLENLHLLSDDDDNEVTDYMNRTTDHTNSPSILTEQTVLLTSPKITHTQKRVKLSTTVSSMTLPTPAYQPYSPVHTPLSMTVATAPSPTSYLQPFSPISPNLFANIMAPSPSYLQPLSPLAGISRYMHPMSPIIASQSAPTQAPLPSRTTRSMTVRVSARRPIVKIKKLEVKWTRQDFRCKVEIEDQIFEKPTEIKTPLEYFQMFLSEDILELIVQQTNLYHMQLKGVSLNVTVDEIKDFIAINILMGVISMTAYTDYWSRALRHDKIASIMPLKRFQQIRRYLHFADNELDDGDRYYKIRPFLEKNRVNCLKIMEEVRFSIDEMMVPYKGTRAGSRKQYIKNKPRKWGFKIFVRAGSSGIVYDFLVYGGEDTFRYNSFSLVENGMGLGAKVVLALTKTMHSPACKVLYFDNYFTSIELVHHLRNEYGILSLGTIKQNRLRGAEKKLPSDKELKKKGRGAFVQVVSNKKKMALLKWFDNKCVTAISSYVDAEPVQTAQRFNKEAKSKVPVPCPKMIQEYNAHMGGVDLADMLVALYRTEMRAHRWYIPLFSQMLDICVNNSWLLYRRHCNGTKTMKLKDFRCSISESLTTVHRVVETNSTKRRLITPGIAVESRYDKMGHMPGFMTKGRCRKCVKHQTKYMCIKCNARLCLVEGRNCFYDYHESPI